MCEVIWYVVVKIDSISNFRIYTSWMSPSAKSNVDKVLSTNDGNDETEAMAQQLNALAEQAEHVQQTQQAEKPKDVSSLPWASLMFKLNLTPTGNYTKDYNATISRLDELIKYTQNPDKLQEYLSIADTVSKYFVQPQVSSISKNSTAWGGSEQIAQLNKIMMLNMKAK